MSPGNAEPGRGEIAVTLAESVLGPACGEVGEDTAIAGGASWGNAPASGNAVAVDGGPAGELPALILVIIAAPSTPMTLITATTIAVLPPPPSESAT